MSYDRFSMRNGRAVHGSDFRSPLRHVSNASSSSTDSVPVPSNRSSALSSATTASATDYRSILGHKRGVSDLSATFSENPKGGKLESSKRKVSIERQSQSLRTLPQPHNTVQPLEERRNSPSSVHARAKSFEQNLLGEPSMGTSFNQETAAKQTHSVGVGRSESRRLNDSAVRRTGSISGQPSIPQNLLESSELQQLERSSTSHLRTLSKFANDKKGDFSINSPDQEVVGLHGRRRFQRTTTSRTTAPGYGGRTWIDTQRQFLQAYEYLCHIGEAKEWIEDVIQKPIPAIVQLEEALRNGIILAEVVQALNPSQGLRIFRSEKLQFRHSDNIAIFFRFLAEVELPDLFRFELVDLYEKKNIPKVIYCIHALSWILLRKGLVDFQIGNLVGKLEFEQHELEATQKGLDIAGVSMPNFSGMRQDFGAEPEPVETEDQRIDRELREHEAAIAEFQSQARGALMRLQLGDTMQWLWDNEEALIDLQSRIRGDFSRQIAGYRQQMRQFAIKLQSQCLGHIVRARNLDKERHWKSHEKHIILIQSAIRAHQSRADTKHIKSQVQAHYHDIKHFQSAIRGALARWQVTEQVQETRQATPDLKRLQARIRGFIARQERVAYLSAVQSSEKGITAMQSAIRGTLERRRIEYQLEDLNRSSGHLIELQANIRAMSMRRIIEESHLDMNAQTTMVEQTQAAIRGNMIRQQCAGILEALADCHEPTSHLQGSIRGYLQRQRVALDVSSVEREVEHTVDLQASARGYNQRQRIYDLICELNEHDEANVALQSILRGMIVRAQLGDTLESLDSEEDTIVEFQAAIRGMLVRAQFAEKRHFFNENMRKVIKIQSFVRGKQQGQAYKSLTAGKNPPVSTVKNFVHLLNDSNFDFEEEVESEKLRKQVGQRVRENDTIQQEIDDLDAKIGLLAHNKIARDEYAKIQKHYGGSSLAINRTMSSKEPFNLKALNKSSRAKLELYQELMFIIQTQPRYLARLFKTTREHGVTDTECKRLELLVSSAFGFTQRRREEYHLLKLISDAIAVEGEGCDSIHEFSRGNYFFSRLFRSYTRSPKDRKYTREIIGTVIKTQILDNMHLDLESDPLTIYRTAINDEELSTGRRSARNKDVPREEAIRDPQTRDAFIRHLQDMRDIVDHFLLLLEDALPRMPYGIRFVAAEMFDSLQHHFSREGKGAVLQVVGNWVWKTYFKPLFAEPEHFGLVDRQLDAMQRRNLGELVRVISQAASGKLFGSENVYLQPLNSYMTEVIGRMEEIWSQIIQVKDLNAQFDYDEYADLHAKVKPTLHIKAADIFAIHHIIAENVLQLCRGPEDAVLREVIRDLGSAKSNEAEMSAGSAEVTLSLSSKMHTFDDPDADVKALFLETKRCVLYIIRVQAGMDLLDIMVKPVTEDDEARWAQLVHEELTAESRRRGAYSDGTTNLVDMSSMSYTEMKTIALQNILELQKRGRLARQNHYQDLLNEIAIDIRQKHKRRVQRQRELENVRDTLAHLEEKQGTLFDTRKAYEDTFQQNLNVLQNKKGKKRFIMPFGKQYNHERELARQGRTPTYGSFKYSGEALAQKGILVDWKGRDLRHDDIVIASDEVNQFSIDGMSGTMMLPGAHSTFSWNDLLSAQYQGERTLRFFESIDGTGHGELILDTRLFMQQVSKKFWPEG